MDFQYRHHSTGDMCRPYKFELRYDHQSYRPNRPINARLHQQAQGFGPGVPPTSSLPTSPLDKARRPLQRTPRTVGSHAELSAYAREQQQLFQPAEVPGSNQQQQQLQSTRSGLPPSLARSVSMPQLQEHYLQQREGRTSHVNSRKSSLVSNCSHTSREGSVGSEMSEGSDAHCHRHHHRRGSVAIKFEERRLMEGQECAVDEQDQEEPEKEWHFNRTPFNAG